MEDDIVQLELRAEDEEAPEDTHGDHHHRHQTDLTVDASALDFDAWNDLIRHCSSPDVRCALLLIKRSILQKHSTYFRSLFGGNFRDSSWSRVPVVWDMPTFCSLLQCMCLGELQISTSNFEPLLEGASFFGVQRVMSALSFRLQETASSLNLLKFVPRLWSIAEGMGLLSVADSCLKIFAVNFEDVMQQTELQNLSTKLLASCIDHEHLTVRSEKTLCQLVLNWFWCCQDLPTCVMEPLVHENQLHSLNVRGQESNYEELFETLLATLELSTISIFQKVRPLLLPVDFVLEHLYLRLPARVFYSGKMEGHGYDELIFSIEKAGRKKPLEVLDDETDELSPRITEHTVCLDFAGCQQLTMAMLFKAVLQTLRRKMDVELRLYMEVEEIVQKCLCNEGIHSLKKCLQPNEVDTPLFVPDFCKLLCVINLCEINFSKCWRLEQEKLVLWIMLVCPNLKSLNVSDCPQLKVNILMQVSPSCKNLEALDISLYSGNAIGQSGGAQAETKRLKQREDKLIEISYHPQHLLTSLTSVSFQGRRSLTDADLQCVANCCPNILAVNLRGCSNLTDRGISLFLARFDHFRSLEVAYTEFGQLSISTILRGCPEYSGIPVDLGTQNCSLLTLDFEGCQNLDSIHLSKILRVAHLLVHLTLAITTLDDNVIVAFKGTSLQRLDVRETQVSHVGLAHVILRNPSLKVLNIRGCKPSVIDGDFLPAVSFLKEALPKEMVFQDLAVGWGFSDSTLETWKDSLFHLRSLSFGLGARISDEQLVNLSQICPSLEQFSLCFQVASSESLMNSLHNLQNIRELVLDHCLQDVSPSFARDITTNLTSLTIKRGAEWMTDEDLYLLSRNCQNMRKLSLVGCKHLTANSLDTISCQWQGMLQLQLEECGEITSKGGSSLFRCKSLQRLVLRHNGSGLQRGYVLHLLSELPMLQELSLDMCDSVDNGFDTPSFETRQLLGILKLARCTTLHTPFKGYMQWKDTILILLNGDKERTFVINGHI